MDISDVFIRHCGWSPGYVYRRVRRSLEGVALMTTDKDKKREQILEQWGGDELITGNDSFMAKSDNIDEVIKRLNVGTCCNDPTCSCQWTDASVSRDDLRTLLQRYDEVIDLLSWASRSVGNDEYCKGMDDPCREGICCYCDLHVFIGDFYREESTPSEKLISFKNNGVEKVYIDKNEEVHVPGYHLVPIKKGVVGEISKIQEEVDKLVDAHNQNVKIMELCELSDLLGAINAYLGKHHPGISMEDLSRMAQITLRVKTQGQ